MTGLDTAKYLHSEITGKILQSFYHTYNQTGYGFEKSIYINSLQIELQKNGLTSETNKTVEVYYQTIDVGNYTADILVENKVLIKISTKNELCAEDELTLFNHLKVSILEVGLLLNFGITPQQKRKVYTNDIKTSVS